MLTIDRCAECGEPLTVGDDPEPQHVFCDLCGRAEHPADLTPDWNGETGNHLSCEDNDEADRAANRAMSPRNDHAPTTGGLAAMDRCPGCGALVADHAAPDPSKPAGSREWRGCPPLWPVTVEERLARMDAQIAAMQSGSAR